MGSRAPRSPCRRTPSAAARGPRTGVSGRTWRRRSRAAGFCPSAPTTSSAPRRGCGWGRRRCSRRCSLSRVSHFLAQPAWFGVRAVTPRLTPMVRPTDPRGGPAGAGRDGLTEADLDPDPIEAFRAWLAAAVEAKLTEPTSMVVATSTPEGVPSARNVFLKAGDQRGFVFYTNQTSRKGRELAANPRAALVFLWKELERQVLVTGGVVSVDAAEADAYFATRPRGSQLSAWASRQSAV